MCSVGGTSCFTKITCILTSFLMSLEQFLRAVWEHISRATALFFPQIKLNSPLSGCAFIFQLTQFWFISSRCPSYYYSLIAQSFYIFCVKENIKQNTWRDRCGISKIFFDVNNHIWDIDSVQLHFRHYLVELGKLLK